MIIMEIQNNFRKYFSFLSLFFIYCYLLLLDSKCIDFPKNNYQVTFFTLGFLFGETLTLLGTKIPFFNQERDLFLRYNYKKLKRLFLCLFIFFTFIYILYNTTISLNNSRCLYLQIFYFVSGICFGVIDKSDIS